MANCSSDRAASMVGEDVEKGMAQELAVLLLQAGCSTFRSAARDGSHLPREAKRAVKPADNRANKDSFFITAASTGAGFCSRFFR